MKKLLITTLITFLFMAGVVMLFYFWPKDISRTIPAVKYQLGEENINFVEHTTIHIEGKFDRNLFSESKFTGKLRVDNDQDLLAYDRTQLFMSNSKSSDMWSMLLFENNNGKLKHHVYGNMYMNNSFSEIVILKATKTENGGSWSGSDGFMIAAPATTREEAIELSKKLIRDNDYIH